MIVNIVVCIIWGFLSWGFYQAMVDVVIEEMSNPKTNHRQKAEYAMLYGALCLGLALFPLLWIL